MEHHLSENVAQQVLGLLRRYGWHTGYQKLAELLPANEGTPASAVHELFLAWRAWEDGLQSEAETHFRRVDAGGSLTAWAAAGLGFVALGRKEGQLEEAERNFQRAAAMARADDNDLRAVIEHGLGTLAYRQGKVALARRYLGGALARLPAGHFQIPRVYDTLGMCWSDTGNFFIASEFFRRSLELKRQAGEGEVDEQGVAITCGQLGRLCLSWGLLDQAEEYFTTDLAHVERRGDARSRAQIYNHLGQIAIRRLQLASNGSLAHESAAHLESALGWLDSCIDLARHSPALLPHEAFGRKDRALALCLGQQLEAAEQDLLAAEAAFQKLSAAHGLAQVDLVGGMHARLRGDFTGSLGRLRKASLYFGQRQPVERALALFEIARTRLAAGQARPVVQTAFQEAIDAAEATRRGWLVGLVEVELERFDGLSMIRRVARRARGKQVRFPTTSLISAERETATVLYLDMRESTSFARGRDPEFVLLVVNQLLGDLADVVDRGGGQVSTYRGDGFLALWRGMNHARRAVEASLELVACAGDFNIPLRQLGYRPIEVRIGIATGELCFGNIGTYDKMDYTAIGATANLGARLESIAEPGMPCISAAAREAVGDAFVYSTATPQWVELKGIGRQACWHVMGRNQVPGGAVP